ncbi:Bax inhibitor-1/YccA family protein [Sphingomonas alba]|uniref:Bax inhibitor-1/YccA family protein n=1 Tax=Sphingomonas alba TaxID=2908208 RepID=A0ABT0RNQ1_9SPHN|nr:Bax inhibitor-1/YccA family protein [Sphingomonas alba]MCL6684279.1 Bax inhibitor-1/YccA family protein [Sphingomonas alba]
MQNQFDPRTRTTGFGPAVSVGVPSAARDAGLRSYMLKVYNYMASGVLLTGIVALLFSQSPFFTAAFNVIQTPQGTALSPSLLGWVITFAPLIFVLIMSFGQARMQTATLQMMFWGFAVAMGLSMSTVFVAYTGVSIAQTFFAVAAAFAGLSLWGYTTKKDLSGFGTFLIMGVWGLLAAMAINLIFLRSVTFDLAISAIGVLLFAGLTAYDTQKIKSIYFAVAGHGEALAKTAIMGALNLYLDFINMFLFLLRFMGDRR